MQCYIFWAQKITSNLPWQLLNIFFPIFTLEPHKPYLAEALISILTFEPISDTFKLNPIS